MQQQRYYKKSKKTTVQLTSLLDLLFVMIFVSLIQQKNIPDTAKVEKKEPKTKVVKTTIVKTVKSKEVRPQPSKYNIQASFDFYATADNPGTPPGKYEMQGTFDEKSGKLNLFGASWIKRPTGFDMVPLSGNVDEAKTSFRGRVDAPFCKSFTLNRLKINDGNSISGIWKGRYDCGQGATGLTLTIK